MTTFKAFAGTAFSALIFGIIASGGPARADQVFNDDVIITGSLCVGFDCTSGMSFGFDTVILKENNTRLLFDDTSTSSGFPANDWRLIANDSSSGGANFFAIEDATAARQLFRVTAGAPANSIFVAATGRVGFRTSTPVLDLHVNTNNTPGMRLEQNSSGGFAAQTWDIAGNEANFFVRDVTGGSRLPFRIRPGAPTSSIDIAATGNVGIGIISAPQKLSVAGAVQVSGSFSGATASTGGLDYASPNLRFIARGPDTSTNGGLQFISTRSDGSNTTFPIVVDTASNIGIGTTSPAAQLHTTGTVRFAGIANCASGIRSDASGNLSCIVSSRQFKTIAGPLTPAKALANVMAMRPQIGAYKTTPGVPEHWLIAENVAAIDPALAGFADGKPYTVKTQNVVADLVAVIQMQQRRIDALEKKIAR